MHLLLHATMVHRVLNIAADANLSFKLTQAQFALEETILLGTRTSRSGNSPDENKVEALRKFPPLSDVPPMRFLGLANFIRPFGGLQFAKAASPLQETLQKDGFTKFPLTGKYYGSLSTAQRISGTGCPPALP